MNVTIPYATPDDATIWRAGWNPLALTGAHAGFAWMFVIVSAAILASLWALSIIGYNKNLASWQTPRRWGVPFIVGMATWMIFAWLAASYVASNQAPQVVMNSIPSVAGTSYHPTTSASQSQRFTLGASRHDIDVNAADSLIRSQIVMTYGFTVTSKATLGNTINPLSPVDSVKVVATTSDGSPIHCTLSKTGDRDKDALGRVKQAVMKLECEQ